MAASFAKEFSIEVMIKLNIGTASGWLQRLDGMKGAGELFKLTRLCKIQSFITKGRPHSRPSQLK
ncbi:MAG: hypothetical protein DME85_12930 [Verrucomicrobia bacterium]|nr:MAG: hypothetical protein DME85_12930 [Verrucomicrobiota bacterium]